MLNFRNVSAASALAIAAAALLPLDEYYFMVFSAFIFCLYIGLAAWGAYKIEMCYYGPALCSAPGKQAYVSITFDDGPEPGRTEAVLEILDRYGAKATFFVIGKKIDANKHILQEILKRGHQIGCHSYSHSPYFPFMRRSSIIRDINACCQAIENVTGHRPDMFRPPFGVTNPRIAGAARKLGLKVAGWSIRSLDTTGIGRSRILERVLPKLRPGQVLLLHDTTPGIEAVLEDILLHLQQNRLKSITMDKLFA
jgi:peptidoglycan-N-acetylglucosamine deacetylase